MTDLRLQDLDGMTLVARCAELRGERETPQCVVVTGFGTVEGAVKAMRAGALTYLQKPVDLGILRQTRASRRRERIALERREPGAAHDARQDVRVPRDHRRDAPRCSASST